MIGMALFLALAQAPAPPASTPDQQTYTFRTDVHLVTFTATVIDSQGRWVRGLRKEHVGVWEDGARQQIALFRSEVEPVSLGIVFDTSGSMRNKIEDVADAVAHFAATAQPDDDIFLMRFSSRVHLEVDFTGDRDRLGQAARGLHADGATVLYDAVAAGLDKVLQGRHRKRALVVITDGQDTSSRTRLNDVLEMAHRAEVLVYCIGIGAVVEHRDAGRSSPQISMGRWPWPVPRVQISGRGGRNQDTVDMEILQTLAEAGGARAYHLPTNGGGVGRIDEVTQEISAELRQQYTIGYYPSNPVRDGAYRRIQITTSFPEYRVRARRGYYAPRD